MILRSSGKGQERDEPFPGVTPAATVGRVLGPRVQGFERLEGPPRPHLRSGGDIDRSQCRGDFLRSRRTRTTSTHRAGLHGGLSQVAPIASGNPVSPSQHTISTSRISRFRSSAQTPAQNFAPSYGLHPDPQHAVDPVEVRHRAIQARGYARWPSRTFTTKASR